MINSSIKVMNWTPAVPKQVNVSVSIPIEHFKNVRTQYDRMLLAEKILEAIELSAVNYQQFVNELRNVNGLDVQPWPYPFTKKEI